MIGLLQPVNLLHLNMFSLNSKVNFVIRHLSSNINKPPTFGLIFDIDGVLAKGKTVIPGVPEVFNKCITNKGKFCIPTVFLTNSSNEITRNKAQQLSEWLKVKVTEEQVILCHGPLKLLYKEFHNKNVFITGQGPIEGIVQELGIKKVVTVEYLRKVFPQLDVVDLKRKNFKINSNDHTFNKIDVILLIGEPVRWETALQLVIDLLLSDGDPRCTYYPFNYPHIPILACNPDLQYMAAAHMPRFGHGTFLLCLESLYKKITGNNLTYKYLVGKPSVATFRFAEKKVLEQADILNSESRIRNLYMIGDNLNTDIFGANLFNEVIKKDSKDSDIRNQIQNCYSVLVKTGVYNENQNMNNELDHLHRDFTHLDKSYSRPNHIVEGVNDAIELIFELEGFKK